MTQQLAVLLRQLRKARSLTLVQASQHAGISRSALTRWEKGIHQPRLAELDALLTALDATQAQRHQALALVDAPRARVRQQEMLVQLGEHARIAPMPIGGDLLRAMRHRRGISTEQTAGLIGVSSRTVQRWEKGDIWPDCGLLHSLCSVLRAEQAEIAALTDGLFHSGGSYIISVASLEELEAHHTAVRNCPHFRTGALADLQFLSQIARVWPFAVRSDAGRNLLGRIYHDYARYLYNRRRYSDALEYAERSIETMPEETTRLHAVLIAANALAARNTPHAANQALRRIRHETPPLEPILASWLQASRAEFLGQSGAMEQALRLNREACRIALDAPVGELERRQSDLVNLLLEADQPAEALTLLENLKQPATPDYIYFRCRLLELHTKAYLQLGELSAAHTILQHLNDYIAEYDLVFHRLSAEKLAQRF